MPEFPGQLHCDIFQEDADFCEGSGSFFQFEREIHVEAGASPSSFETRGEFHAGSRAFQQGFLGHFRIFATRVAHTQEAGLVGQEEMDVLDVVLDYLQVQRLQEGNHRFAIFLQGFGILPCLQKRLLHLWNLEFTVKQEAREILVRRSERLQLHLDLLDLIADKYLVFLPVGSYE